jgi:hypothetical protein
VLGLGLMLDAAGFDSVDGTTALFKRRYLERLPKWRAIAEAQDGLL